MLLAHFYFILTSSSRRASIHPIFFLAFFDIYEYFWGINCTYSKVILKKREDRLVIHILVCYYFVQNLNILLLFSFFIEGDGLDELNLTLFQQFDQRTVFIFLKNITLKLSCSIENDYQEKQWSQIAPLRCSKGLLLVL